MCLQDRNANVTINAVHPGIVKTGIIRAHKGLFTGKTKLFKPYIYIEVQKESNK